MAGQLISANTASKLDSSAYIVRIHDGGEVMIPVPGTSSFSWRMGVSDTTSYEMRSTVPPPASQKCLPLKMQSPRSE